MKNRIIAFDLIKLFAIFLVIEGHCTQHLLSSFEYDEPVYVYIYSFHMPLFMFLSGYFSFKKNIDIKTAWGGVIKRFSQLIIPSAVAMALHLLLLSALSNDISIFSNPQAWRTELFSTLWFLKSLFICYVIYMAIIVVPKPYRYFLIFLVILVTPFIKYFRILYMFPCFILGVISHKHDYIIKYNTIVQIISAPIFILCLAFWNSGAFTLNLVSFHGLLSGEITPLLIFFKQYSYVLLTGISGALFFTSFLFRCFSRYEKSTILCKLSDYGTYTLGIYIIQTFLLETVLSAYVKFDLYFSPIICNVFIIPFASLIILCVSILLVKLINRNKLLSSLLIGSNK